MVIYFTSLRCTNNNILLFFITVQGGWIFQQRSFGGVSCSISLPCLALCITALFSSGIFGVQTSCSYICSGAFCLHLISWKGNVYIILLFKKIDDLLPSNWWWLMEICSSKMLSGVNYSWESISFSSELLKISFCWIWKFKKLGVVLSHCISFED